MFNTEFTVATGPDTGVDSSRSYANAKNAMGVGRNTILNLALTPLWEPADLASLDVGPARLMPRPCGKSSDCCRSIHEGGLC